MATADLKDPDLDLHGLPSLETLHCLSAIPLRPSKNLANDRVLGGGILAGSIVGAIVYGVLMYFWPVILLELTAFVAVVLLLGIPAWIGWTMASTPSPEAAPEISEPVPVATGEGRDTQSE